MSEPIDPITLCRDADYDALLADNERLREALLRLLERFEREYAVSASGTIPHEVTIARAALSATERKE